MSEPVTRGAPVTSPARPAQDLGWMLTSFIKEVPGVAHAVAVSSDGLPLAFSAGSPPARADQLAAITSGLTSLTQGASRVFEGGAMMQTVVEMQRGPAGDHANQQSRQPRRPGHSHMRPRPGPAGIS
jgi:hypothetical protein